MSSDDLDAILARAARRAAPTVPELVAPLVEKWKTAFEVRPSSALKVSDRAVNELALCRRPRAESWIVDVEEISAAVGIRLELLVSFLRAAEAVERFGDAHAADDGHDGRLLAARDFKEDEDE